MAWSDKMGLLEILIIIVVLIWLTGAFVIPVGGSLIHLLLLIVLILVIVRLAQGRSVI
jgi:Family of unknown function (DUF5670)